MQKDIKELLKDYKEENIELSVNHTNKFQDLLNNELHQEKPKKKNFKWFSIAASLVLLLSLAIKFYPTKTIIDDPKINTKEISLGTIIKTV